MSNFPETRYQRRTNIFFGRGLHARPSDGPGVLELVLEYVKEQRVKFIVNLGRFLQAIRDGMAGLPQLRAFNLQINPEGQPIVDRELVQHRNMGDTIMGIYEVMRRMLRQSLHLLRRDTNPLIANIRRDVLYELRMRLAQMQTEYVRTHNRLRSRLPGMPQII